MSRRKGGRETWNRLINWDRGQSDSERLAAHILKSEGYSSIDPSHPLGGKDGGKDIICSKDELKMIGAVYFPRREKTFADIKNKFLNDLDGVKANGVDGIVFVTNQELTLKQRKELSDLGKESVVELYHLERIANLLDNPINYGIRFEFLDIEFTKEEFLSFQAIRDKEYYEKIEGIYTKISEVLMNLDNACKIIVGHTTGGDSYGYISIYNGFSKDNDIKGAVFISRGEYPLYNISIRIVDLSRPIGTWDLCDIIPEVKSNTASIIDYIFDLKDKTIAEYNIFISTRNSHITELLRLCKVNGVWKQAIRVISESGEILYEEIDQKFPKDNLKWR